MKRTAAEVSSAGPFKPAPEGFRLGFFVGAFLGVEISESVYSESESVSLSVDSDSELAGTGGLGGIAPYPSPERFAPSSSPRGHRRTRARRTAD
tara:strand:- start:64621 stop:64902 length:282 start_codon:yes stop_codon:yes gene_type:complete